MEIQRISSVTAAFSPTPREQLPVREISPTAPTAAVAQQVSRQLSDQSATKVEENGKRVITRGKERSEGSFADKEDEQEEQKTSLGDKQPRKLDRKA